MIRFAGSFLAALASFLVEVGLALGRRQAAREIAADATREAEAARVAVGKAQDEARAKGDVASTLRRGEF